MSDFTWAPDYGAQAQIEPKVRVTKFGDGYEQRSAYGINVTAESWPLTFTSLDQSTTADIIAFFVDKNAVISFNWTPPGESTPKKWVCRQWTKQVNAGNLFTITATFDRVYDA